MTPLFSVITPTRGDRPNGLQLAGQSLEAASNATGLNADAVEWLIGFDGVKGTPPETSLPLQCVDFPMLGHFGNYIRNQLLAAARGERVLFLDDDNAYTKAVFTAFLDYPDVDFCAARIDVSRAFDIHLLPRLEDAERTFVRQGNIDPLCLCLSRDLVVERCGGWKDEGGYESDYLNILRYYRRARSRVLLDSVIGVYDAGAGLDSDGINPRQAKRVRGQKS